MIRTTVLHPPLRVERRFVLAAFVALAVTAGLVLTALVGINLTVAAAPPGVALSMADGAADVPLDARVSATPGGWDARVERATLVETARGPDGALDRLASCRPRWTPCAPARCRARRRPRWHRSAGACGPTPPTG